MKKESKEVTKKLNFYFTILNELSNSTNLSKIKEKLNISKQKLNYYIRGLKRQGFIYNKGYGWWELTEKGKNPTKYAILLKEDSSRGHAYIWETEIEKIPDNWKNRIEILKEKQINFKIVGAKENTPRIKVLGRKVWLCNNHLRIFDTEKSSYYGDNPEESRKLSKAQAVRIIHSLETKLGISLNPNKIKFKKEHYAFIKNSLAINQNQEGVIWRISDETGEWLLIDDSLEQGGELEVIGKKAFKTSPKLQKWWNLKKKYDFEIDDDYIQNNFKEVRVMIKDLSEQNIMLSQVLEQMNRNLIKLTKQVHNN